MNEQNYLANMDRVLNYRLWFVIYNTFKLFGIANYRKEHSMADPSDA